MATRTKIVKISDQISNKHHIPPSEFKYYVDALLNQLPDTAQVSGHGAVQAAVTVTVPAEEELRAKFEHTLKFLDAYKTTGAAFDEDALKRLNQELDGLFNE